MTKSDLIRILTDKQPQLPFNVVESAVKLIFEQMTATLGNGNRIEVRDFGSFSLRYRAPRLARNPKTGERVETESKFAVHFKPGKELKDRVNNAAR